MPTANKCIRQGAGLAPVLLKRAPTIELDWDVRQISRFEATDSQGRAIGVQLHTAIDRLARTLHQRQVGGLVTERIAMGL